jgi:hypothetical protein
MLEGFDDITETLASLVTLVSLHLPPSGLPWHRPTDIHIAMDQFASGDWPNNKSGVKT